MATQSGDRTALEEVAAQWREQFDAPEITSESIICDGCLGTDDGRRSGCSTTCEIRTCATKRPQSIANCAHCIEYAGQNGTCTKLESLFADAPDARAVLNEIKRGLEEEMREGIARVVRVHLPGRTVQAIKDRGTWGGRIVEITLDGGEVVVFKTSFLGDGQDPQVLQIFHEHGLPGPRVLAVDTSREIIPHSFIILERVGGTQLGDLLDQVDEADALAIYETLGRLYGRMHAVHNDWSGVWWDIPDKPLPSVYMYQAEIVGGSGRRALEQGRIAQRTYDRAVALWAEHLSYLQDHQPSLIHYSPFLWNIHLERGDRGWCVTRLTSLGDVMWWDPVYDLACLRYPPFGEVNPTRWEAFLRGYGLAPERKRLFLYAVMQRFCAAMGTYWEPQSARNKVWAASCLEDVETFLDEIERDSLITSERRPFQSKAQNGKSTWNGTRMTQKST